MRALHKFRYDSSKEAHSRRQQGHFTHVIIYYILQRYIVITDSAGVKYILQMCQKHLKSNIKQDTNCLCLCAHVIDEDITWKIKADNRLQHCLLLGSTHGCN